MTDDEILAAASALMPGRSLKYAPGLIDFYRAAYAAGVRAGMERAAGIVRANGSNVVGAAVDSLMFPTIAFGALMPGIIVAQFAAKVAGGAMWAWLINRRVTA